MHAKPPSDPRRQSQDSRRHHPAHRQHPKAEHHRTQGSRQRGPLPHHKAPYLDYPAALAGGWPIATGVIEGACRHLVADRLDITGARWGLHGAEAILQIRALRSNGDFDDYWDFHQQQEHHRVHAVRYTQDTIPRAA